MGVVIYHNPRCSKSRSALKLLEEKNIDFEIVEYLKTPPSKEKLEEILGLLNLAPRELIRTSEPEYKNNNLDNPTLIKDQLLDAMVEFPILIQRPIVVANGAARIGRPPEKVLEIL